MKSNFQNRVWGCHVHRVKNNFRVDGVRSGDVMVMAYIRKTPVRKTPYPKHVVRIKPFQREKAAIIKLRKLGYPTNMLSKALGRSTSYIHRVLRAAIMRLCLRPCDMRKLPGKTREYQCRFRWDKLLKYLPAWEKWILGEGEKPP